MEELSFWIIIKPQQTFIHAGRTNRKQRQRQGKCPEILIFMLRGVLRLQKKSTKLPEPILALSSKLRNFLTIFLESENFKLYDLMVSFSLNEFSKQQFSFE